MQYCFYGKTDRGRKRKKNEDFILDRSVITDETLFIVSDGMGGHKSGDIASRLASVTFADRYRELRCKGVALRDSMLDALNLANNRVYQQSGENDRNNGMGTTLSVLVINGNRLSITHIGDSRIYLVRDSGIQCLTRDHTLVAKLLEDGHISPREALEHPRKNILYQSVGVDRKVNPQIISDFKIKAGDIYIMCSDGLSNMLKEEEIRDTVAGHFPREAVLELIKTANRKGGDDNISVQVIKFDGHETFEQTKKLQRKSSSGVYLLIILAVLVVTLLLTLIIR